MGSKSRRRRRGLGPNGIATTPTTTAKRKPVDDPTENSLQAASRNSFDHDRTVEGDNKTSAGRDREASVAITAPIPETAPVSHSARVQILRQAKCADQSGLPVTRQYLVATVMAIKLCSASARFDALVRSVPSFRIRNVFNFVILEEHASSYAITEFAKWLSTISAPFPNTYLGVKHLPTADSRGIQYDIIEISALYKLAKWLDLKVPFSSGRLLNKMWAYFMDESHDMYPEEIIAIWKATPEDDIKLRKHVVWNTVAYVERKTDEKDVKTYESFRDAFETCSDTSLLEAFKERFKVSTEIRLRKAQQKQHRQEARARRQREEKEWREKEGMLKMHYEQAKQKIGNRRGISLISSNDLKNIDLAALRGRP
ncbi:uncharacterized protein PV09_06146 [Verruconis gallopava]|uniref:Uncharacterized protein n=1 Tax=Verruconis gallopava TaxID=253628 RepID=A0A0D2AU82_9PEZI|nr:uncharacterized protein PV09_06146 [Verruconis gallopava]KIW02709.1 hypothetical protein PV09_06146 [Verruconis gallopava]